MRAVLCVFVVIFVEIVCGSYRNFTQDGDGLLSVVQIFRHGQRTPLHFYPTDPYSNASYWPVAPGELTNEGKLQLYSLGQQTRTRYRHFIPPRYSKTDFKIQTTDLDRTHMSAQAFLAGLFPPVKQDVWNPNIHWQPIPVHVIDTMVLSPFPKCPGYLTEVADVMVFDEFYAKLNKKYAEVYKYVSRNTDRFILVVQELQAVYDTLLIEEQFGYELPKWTKGVYPEPMRLLSVDCLKALSYNDKLKKLAIGLWFQTLLNHFEDVIQGKPSQKYQVFSGHDTNIASILNTLGAFDNRSPQFGSSLYFELRQKNDSYFVNLWYRSTNEISAIKIKNCGIDCDLEALKTFLKPWLVDKNTWEKECNNIYNRRKILWLVKRIKKILN